MIYSKYKLYQEAEAAGGGESSRQRASRPTAELEFEIERLLLITEAMWSLLSERHGYTEEDLLRRVYEVDAADGSIDGRKGKIPAADCPSCQRKLMRGRPKCIYCGSLSPCSVFER